MCPITCTSATNYTNTHCGHRNRRIEGKPVLVRTKKRPRARYDRKKSKQTEVKNLLFQQGNHTYFPVEKGGQSRPNKCTTLVKIGVKTLVMTEG